MRRYRSKISGPLLDRIDLHVEVPKLPRGALATAEFGEESTVVRLRVVSARERQLGRAESVNSTCSRSTLGGLANSSRFSS